MSKGHQVRRRRNYGRRQHELHERRLRREVWNGFEIEVEDGEDGELIELFDAFRAAGRQADGLFAPREPWLAEAS